MNFKLLFLLISIPLLAELSMFVIGLIGLVLINIIYFPISWLGEPFFVCNSEVGCYPRIYGRILMTTLIICLYLLYIRVVKKKKLFGKSN
jgi:xanthosine utilization system XapX-like protein